VCYDWTQGKIKMKHEMKIRSIYFDKIKSGEKNYEIRLNDEKRKLIDVGDIIIFKREPELKEELITEVKDLVYFNSFDEMLNTLPIKKIGFQDLDKESVKKIYYQFYSKEAEKQCGVVAIKVKVL